MSDRTSAGTRKTGATRGTTRGRRAGRRGEAEHLGRTATADEVPATVPGAAP